MSWILLANDDGVDSPALVPFAQSLAKLAEVRVVVPDSERSWIAKAITRFEPVRVESVEREGVTIHACSGTPADGVQLGIHTLFDSPPDLVVSGINLGYNHGTAFLMSSGTVGAAAEGWLAGIPSIAVSTGVMADFLAWRSGASDPAVRPAWDRLAGVATEVVADIDRSGLAVDADVVSVNLPFEATGATERRITKLARLGYDQLFHADEDGYSHGFGGFVEFAPLEGTDVDAAHRGIVSVTPLHMPTHLGASTAARETIERAAQPPPR
ncbi:MAG: 5'/3'-nucleotidase SurE [Nitriliruptorales bacterium]|nr:5'/3'-nucleotidase SurE [Nitriliruptorales bacterium]